MADSLKPLKTSGNSKGGWGQGILSRLFSLFGFRPKASSGGRDRFSQKPTSPEVELLQVKPRMDRGPDPVKNILGPRKLSRTLEDLLSAYLSDTTDTFSTLKERQERYRQLEFAYINDPIIGQAVNLLADEAASIDAKERLFEIETEDPNLTRRCYELLEQWEIDHPKIRGLAYNLALYGDGVWALKVTERGVEKVTPFHPASVRERWEFSPVHILRNTASQDVPGVRGAGEAARVLQFQNYGGPISSHVQALLKDLEKNSVEDVSALFESVLFGYLLEGNIAAPPWNILHFRVTPDQSEFFPWGKPLFLHVLAPFRQLSASLSLQALARLQSFPVRAMQVSTANTMTEEDKMEKINEVREQYEGLGVHAQSPESYTVNTTVWLPKELVDMTIHESKVDFDFVQDLELLQDRVIIGTGIPKGYLIVDSGVQFGQSGVALMQQHKPFARRAFTIQSAIARGLIDLFRLHFAVTGEFDYNASISVSLRYSESEITDETIQRKSSSLSLAQDIMNLLKELIGLRDGEVLPAEIAADILDRFTFIDKKDLENYIRILLSKRYNRTLLKTTSDDEEHEDSFGGGDFEGDFGGEGGPRGEGPGGEGEELGSEEEGGGEEGEEEPAGVDLDALFSSRRGRPKNVRGVKLQEDRILRRREELLQRYTESRDLFTVLIRRRLAMNEGVERGRHFVQTPASPEMLPVLKYLKKLRKKGTLREALFTPKNSQEEF